MKFFSILPSESKSSGFGVPSYLAAGEVWDFSTLPDCRPLSTHSVLPSQQPGQRCERESCSNQRHPHTMESNVSFSFSPKPRLFLSILCHTSCCAEVGCCFLSCLLPSPTQARPIYIPESLSYSINKHVLFSYLMPGPGQKHG